MLKHFAAKHFAARHFITITLAGEIIIEPETNPWPAGDVSDPHRRRQAEERRRARVRQRRRDEEERRRIAAERARRALAPKPIPAVHIAAEEVAPGLLGADDLAETIARLSAIAAEARDEEEALLLLMAA